MQKNWRQATSHGAKEALWGSPLWVLQGSTWSPEPAWTYSGTQADERPEGPTGWATTLLPWDWPCPQAWGRLGLMAAWPPGESGQGLTFSVWGQGWLLCMAITGPQEF